ncbi:MAG: hypothetical protein F6J93_12755 [Oscillatoria sp. SIO1A7]|nr:hypothetical protein [Oscillatoria sp. SIO1A7]
MPEEQELNNDSKTGRQANFLDPGQYVEGDNTVNNGDNKYNEAIVQGSDAGETVVNNGGTQTNIGDSIDQRGSVNVANNILCLEPDLLLSAIAEGRLPLTDSQSFKALLTSGASKLPINSDSREQLKKLIANSGELDSIPGRFKSCRVLANYLAEDECRTSLATLMAYSCRQQIINLRGTEYFQDNCNSLAKWFRYCLDWIHHYCGSLKERKISDKSREVLQGYSRVAFDEAFTFLEIYLSRNCTDDKLIGDGELNELRECTKLLYEKIGFD